MTPPWHWLFRFRSHVAVALRARLSDPASQQMATVMVGHVLRLALGLISSAMLARGLGPAGLSVFSVVGAAMAILGTVADFGLSNSAVRYVAGDLLPAPARARATAAIYARLKLFGAVLLLVLVFVLARPLVLLLGLPVDSGPLLLRVGALGLAATALSGLAGTLLRALQRFRHLVATQLINAALTVLLMGGLFLLTRLDVLNALWVGVATALAAAAVGVRLLPVEWRHALAAPAPVRSAASRRLLAFGKWLWVSAIFSILLAQLDLLLLNRLLPAQRVGFYALALNLVFKADIVNQTLHTVLLPRVSGLSGRDAYFHHLRQSLVRSLLLALALALLLPLARPFILAVYGAEYAPAVPVFYALMAVVFFDLFAIPVQLLAFPLDMPRQIVVADVIGVAVLFLGGMLLIPAWGLYGAVVAKLAAKVSGTLVIGLAITRRLRTARSAP